MVRAPTSLEVDTHTAKAMGYVSPRRLCEAWPSHVCEMSCADVFFLSLSCLFTAPQARQLPPLPGPWKPHTTYDPRKWYSSVPVAKSGCETPVSTRHETKYDSTTAPSKWVSQHFWNKWSTEAFVVFYPYASAALCDFTSDGLKVQPTLFLFPPS